MIKTKKIENLLESIAIKKGYEIVDVQYVKESCDWIVRVFIDKKNGGVTVSDCEKMSMFFGVVLDESDILKNPYTLEISSPGLNRVLKKEENFKRFIGSKIKLQTVDPISNQKNFLGNLLDCKDGKIKIDDVSNGIFEINFLDIKKASVETEF
ncbi:MAG: ribosome maturation factor RimP [Endomicrobium sp.]|jgi:ribosome maturation factor RimP|nr:ribosome maturation factor RimP [Endomicrobium sp.]